MEKPLIEDKTDIAQMGLRMLAFIIDFFVFAIIGFIWGFFFGTPIEDGSIGYNFDGLPALVFMLIGIYLWPISEGVFGQTVGKRLLNLKVVTNNYRPIGIGQSFVRFFLGFIDFIFCIGIIVAATNKQNKRIGDLVAKTIVIQIKKPVQKEAL